MMKVILSAFACEPGRGSEQEVGWRWAVELSAKLDVTVITQTRNRPGIERWLAAGNHAGLRLKFEYLELPGPLPGWKSRFDFLTWPYYACWQWMALQRVKELNRDGGIDLVHHLTFASFRVPIWLKKSGLPVVIGPVGGAEQADWALLGYRARPAAWLREAVRNVMTGFSVGLLALIPPVKPGRGLCLAATPGMEAIFRRRGLPVRLFPTIGAEGAGVPRGGPKAEPCRFLYVGRLHILKGVQFLLEAFSRAALPGSTLTVVGSGPEEARLKAQAAAAGLEGRVHWQAAQPRSALGAVYSSHDVLVAPSMYESGGMVVLEAMQHALPCIVLDVGGHAVSVNETCGIKLPVAGGAERVIEGLKGAMERLAADADLRLRMGATGLARVEAEYGWETKVRRMLDIYQEAMDGVPTAGAERAGS